MEMIVNSVIELGNVLGMFDGEEEKKSGEI